jgi:hypothetical protein
MSDEQPMRVQWVDKRTQFAEMAEALATTTDLILAVHSGGHVLWTPEGTEEIWSGTWGRDPDSGILSVWNRRFVATFADFQEEIGKQLRERLGEPRQEGAE